MQTTIVVLEGIAFSVFLAPVLYFWIRVGRGNLAKLGPWMFIFLGLASIAFFILLIASVIAWLTNKDQNILLLTAISNLGLLVLSMVFLRICFLQIK